MIARQLPTGRDIFRRNGFSAVLAAIASILFAGVARAEPHTAGVPDCGGDAYSSAQVIENRPPRRGPLTATPQTLCADLAPRQPPANLEIGVFPSIGRGHGGNGPRAPY